MSAGSGAGASRQIDPSLEQPPQLSVSPALFQKFQKLIYSETGIWLGNSKTALLCGRLFRRLRALEITSLETYYERVSHPDQYEERTRMIDAITTNETRFFREPRQFEFIVQQVLPRWRAQAEHRLRPKRVRIWSAGCSSGEEPYSVAMLLASIFPPSKAGTFAFSPLTSPTACSKKRATEFIPLQNQLSSQPTLLHTFMLRGTADRQADMKVRVEIQQMDRVPPFEPEPGIQSPGRPVRRHLLPQCSDLF